MLAKTLKRAGIGFLIGIVIGNLIALITGNSSTGGVTLATKQLLDMAGGNSVIAMLLQSFFSGLYGALCFAGMSLYESERLPLAANWHQPYLIVTRHILYSHSAAARLGKRYRRNPCCCRNTDRRILHHLADNVLCISKAGQRVKRTDA